MAGRPLYEAAMGPSFGRLAMPVRDFHAAPAPVRYAGRASVERGNGLLARLIGLFMGLPPASPDCAVEIVVTRDAAGSERWARKFAGKAFVSRQRPGRGRFAGLVVESVGPMQMAFALIEKSGALHLELRGWKVLGVPLPRALGPSANASEIAAQGRLNFDVAMGLPLVGPVVHYRGWLLPVANEDAVRRGE